MTALKIALGIAAALAIVAFTLLIRAEIKPKWRDYRHRAGRQ